MKKIKKIFFLLLVVILLINITSCKKNNNKFEYWNDCDSLTTLTNYVSDISDKGSKNYIPVEDRVAVFDMDGTLCGELFPTYLEYLLCAYRVLYDKDYSASDDLKDVGNLIMEGAKGDGTGTYPSDMALIHGNAQAKAFSGLTIDEFETYVKNFLNRNADGFNNLKYCDAFYLPMIEVINYLQQNNFITYIVSGSDRSLCRAFASEKLNIKRNNVIGMDVVLKADNQGTTDSLDYTFTKDDKLVRTDTLLLKNLKNNKVTQIAKEIGKQPVLSFGNSSGDTSMHNYTITNNKYQSKAFMLIADDETRDYGNFEKNTKLGQKWKDDGYNVISMKNDFKTIYGYNVTKTQLTYTF
jgi:phosphoserine phosphatase